AKPVALLSYGGSVGGARAVEQLRLVFAELHTVTVRDSVNLRHAYDLIDETGGFRPPQSAEAAVAQLMTRLHWWAVALRSARAGRHPVPVRGSVNLRHAYAPIDETGGSRPPQSAEAAVAQLLTRLHWWAVALRSARAAQPYPVSA